MILCARSSSRPSEQSKKHRSRSENMWKVCLCYSQNNKLVWLSNMADTVFSQAKVCGLCFPWLCLLGADWLHGQSNSDHMDVSMALLIYKTNMWALITSNIWYTSNGQGENKFLLVHPLRTQEQHGHVYALSCFWWQSAWYKHFPGS